MCYISDDRLLLIPNIGETLFVCTLDGLNSNVIDLGYKPFNTSLYDKYHTVVSVVKAGIQIDHRPDIFEAW